MINVNLHLAGVVARRQRNAAHDGAQEETSDYVKEIILNGGIVVGVTYLAGLEDSLYGWADFVLDPDSGYPWIA